MKITLVMVTSVNGKTTDGNPSIHSWTSKEDQEHFAKLINTHQLLIMGKNTYESAKQMMKHKKGRLRVVLTTSPHTFADQTLPGMLEFTNEKPKDLLIRLASLGFTHGLLLGGATTNSHFLNDHLVNELLLTIEPYIFENGLPLVETLTKISKLSLVSVKKLNKQGTLLLTYTF